MNKMKKIIAFALMMVMMMAMSVTAFAADTTTLTVTNLLSNTVVNVYKVAHVTENNNIETEGWVGTAYTVNSESRDSLEMTSTEVTNITNAFNAKKNDIPLVKTDTVAVGASSVTFTDLEPGIYYIEALNENAAYNPMVSVMVKADTNGNYVGKSDSVKAKGTTDDIEKTADDEIVYAGQVVNFTITKTVPYNANKFIVYDYTENLSSLDGVTATVEIGDSYKGEFDFAETKTANKFQLDLTSLVFDSKADKFINDYENQLISIKYSAKVLGDQGYTNKATFSTKDGEEHGTTTVEGVEGTITLTKVDPENKAITGSEATFKVTHKFTGKDSVEAVKFVKSDAGKYKLAEEKDAEDKVVEEVSTNPVDGKLVLTGLENGEYFFEETVAPTGFSKKTGVEKVVISENKTDVDATYSFINTTLSTLPFTGGMGTTIFTVLGVALMAIAAALYFASKKSAKN